VHSTISTRLYTKQQCTVHFPHVYTQNSSALYIFHTFIHKTAVHSTISTRLYTKQQCTVHFSHVYTQNHNTVLIFLGRAGRKHKHVPQLHQTEKTDRNFGFETTHLCRNVFHSVWTRNWSVWVAVKSFAKCTPHSCSQLHVQQMHNSQAVVSVAIITN